MQRGVHLDDATGRCQHSLRSSAKPQRAPSQMKARVTALSIVILLLSGLLSRRKKNQFKVPVHAQHHGKCLFVYCLFYIVIPLFSQRPAPPLFPLVTEMEIPLQAELFILWPLLLIKSLMTGRKAKAASASTIPLSIVFPSI